jgi:hypothetical protein
MIRTPAVGRSHKTVIRRYFEDGPCHPAACDEIFAPRFLFHTIQRASLTPQTMQSSPTDALTSAIRSSTASATAS